MMRGLRQLRGCVGRVAPRARRARAAKRRRARGRGLLSLRTQGRTPLRARLRCRGLCVCFFGSVFVLGLVRARCPALAPDRDGGIAVGMKRKMPRVLPARGAPVVFVPVARRLNVLVCAVRAAARLCFSCPVGAAPRARRLGVSRGASGRTSSRPTTSPPTSRRASSWAAGARPSASSRATCVGVVGGGGGAFGCFVPPASPPPKQEGSSRARFAPTVDGSRCRRRSSLGGDARCLALHAGATPRRGVSWLAVARAQMLAMPFPSGGEVYVIRKSLFAKTYRALSARTSGRASLLATSGSFVRAVRAARD